MKPMTKPTLRDAAKMALEVMPDLIEFFQRFVEDRKGPFHTNPQRAAAVAVRTLPGIEAALRLALTAPEQSPADGGQQIPSRDTLTDLIAEHLRCTYHCTRVWEAWSVGTMSQDDFEPADESETPAEIADAVLALLATPAAPTSGEPWQPIETAPRDMGSYLFLCNGVALQGFRDATGALCVCLEAGASGNPPWRVMRRTPTHWMPLPAAPGATPPSAAQAEGAKRDELVASIKSTAEHWAYMAEIDNGDAANVARRKHAEKVDQLAALTAAPERLDEQPMRNAYVSSERLSGWSHDRNYTCVGCSQVFKSEHAAAFHKCDYFNKAPAPQQAAWAALPYATPLELWKAFKAGTKFVLHYHDKTHEVTRMEPRERFVYVQPPGMPVKVYPDGRNCESAGDAIWLEQVAAPPSPHQAAQGGEQRALILLREIVATTRPGYCVKGAPANGPAEFWRAIESARTLLGEQ